MNEPKFDALVRAHQRLSEAFAQPETDLGRDGTIQRFEFCFELAWKSIQQLLRDQGVECSSPKGCLREAFKQGWIDDEPAWIAMLLDRNLTSHTYDEELAKRIYAALPAHHARLAQLIQRLREVT